jgi:hypothetical protein
MMDKRGLSCLSRAIHDKQQANTAALLNVSAKNFNKISLIKLKFNKI